MNYESLSKKKADEHSTSSKFYYTHTHTHTHTHTSIKKLISCEDIKTFQTK